MELVTDANIAISALIASQGMTANLLFADTLKLSAHELLLKEIIKHKKEILKKSKFPEKEFELALSLIFSRIKLVPFSKFEKCIQKAKKISPDQNDIEYLALALKLNCPLWSNDKLLKTQREITVINTTELIKKLQV